VERDTPVPRIGQKYHIQNHNKWWLFQYDLQPAPVLCPCKQMAGGTDSHSHPRHNQHFDFTSFSPHETLPTVILLFKGWETTSTNYKICAWRKFKLFVNSFKFPNNL
jgi:hypothetical protein